MKLFLFHSYDPYRLLYRSVAKKTITPFKLKFGGQVFHGVQTDSSKFGVIYLKIKARREFFLFLIGHIVKYANVKNQYHDRISSL